MQKTGLKDICIQIGDRLIRCCTAEESLSFNDYTISKYKVPKPEGDITTFNYSLKSFANEDDPHFQLVFKGDLPLISDLNYTWKVFKYNHIFRIVADFTEISPVKSICAEFKTNCFIVDISIIPREKEALVINPLIHPLGSLILKYIYFWYGGILLHGSAVNYQDKTFLFTGVSGIGKTTMAGLWSNCGAEVINDDRLILKRLNEKVVVYNNPMPSYQQEPRQGNLSGIFLLKQEKYNYIKKIQGVQAFTRVLANCIQQFYDPEMVKKHLALVEAIVQCVPVYEVGFLPTNEIVKDILKYTSDESKG